MDKLSNSLINFFTEKRLIIIIIISLLFVLFSHLDVLDLKHEEPRRAIVSIEMLLSGEYVVPHINGAIYYNKPPLFNWYQMAFLKLFNSWEEWAVRVPSVLALLFTGLFHYLFSKKYIGKKAALLSALFFVTSADILFYFSLLGEIDLFYTMLVYLQVVSFFHFHQQKKYWLMFITSYVFVALGVLAKGLPSLAFQAFTLLGWMIYNRQFKMLLGIRHIVGLIVLVIISGSYFYLYSQRNDLGPFLLNLFSESSQRTAGENPMSDTIQHLLSFPLSILKLLMPWVFFGIFLFVKDFRKTIKENPFLSFALTFFIANIPLYWLSPGTKDRYIYMFLPFLLSVIAYFYTTKASVLPKRNKIVESIFLSIFLLVTLGLWTAPYIEQVKIIENIYSLIIPLFIIGSFIVWLYYKRKNQRALIAVLFIVFVRAIFNFVYLPAHLKDPGVYTYQKNTKNMIKITGNESVYFTGRYYTQHASANLMGLGFGEADLKIPPYIPLQLTYYFMLHNKEVVQYERYMEPGKYYFSTLNMIRDQDNYEVLYQFKEKWHNQQAVLVKLKN